MSKTLREPLEKPGLAKLLFTQIDQPHARFYF